jgi:hypothetical protein
MVHQRCGDGAALVHPVSAGAARSQYQGMHHIKVRRRLWVGVTALAITLAGPTGVAVAATPSMSGMDAATARASADVITVSGNHLLRAGQPWIPKGVQIVGLLPGFPTAGQKFGSAELAAAKEYGADTIRFQVAQPHRKRARWWSWRVLHDAVVVAARPGGACAGAVAAQHLRG